MEDIEIVLLEHFNNQNNYIKSKFSKELKDLKKRLKLEDNINISFFLKVPTLLDFNKYLEFHEDEPSHDRFFNYFYKKEFKKITNDVEVLINRLSTYNIKNFFESNGITLENIISKCSFSVGIKIMLWGDLWNFYNKPSISSYNEKI